MILGAVEDSEILAREVMLLLRPPAKQWSLHSYTLYVGILGHCFGHFGGPGMKLLSNQHVGNYLRGAGLELYRAYELWSICLAGPKDMDLPGL